MKLVEEAANFVASEWKARGLKKRLKSASRKQKAYLSG
jgi:hypothetical protein